MLKEFIKGKKNSFEFRTLYRITFMPTKKLTTIQTFLICQPVTLSCRKPDYTLICLVSAVILFVLILDEATFRVLTLFIFHL